MPAACTRMTISPAPACGRARSVTRNTSGPPGVVISIAFIRAADRSTLLGLRSGLGRRSRRARALGYRLHRQTHAALFVGFDDLDLHRLAFLEIVGHGVDAF